MHRPGALPRCVRSGHDLSDRRRDALARPRPVPHTMSDAPQPAPQPHDAPGQRLSKVVAALVPCSRREAEQYITEGRVRVDGQRVDVPQARVNPAQQVQVDAAARLQPVEAATFLLNKPAGVGLDDALALLDEATRWPGDASGVQRNSTHLRGLRPLMALPASASGLCVFSQAPHITRKLTEDADWLEQEWLAEVTGDIAPGGLARLKHGLVRHGQALPPAHVSWQSEARLRFAEKGIAPPVLAWMCAQVGLQTVALRRLRIGRVGLAGLPLGQWRYLPMGERF